MQSFAGLLKIIAIDNFLKIKSLLLLYRGKNTDKRYKPIGLSD